MSRLNLVRLVAEQLQTVFKLAIPSYHFKVIEFVSIGLKPKFEQSVVEERSGPQYHLAGIQKWHHFEGSPVVPYGDPEHAAQSMQLTTN